MPDAFDLLGIEPRFAIDAAELDRRHRDLLTQLHPDRIPVPADELIPDNAPAPPDNPQSDARAVLLSQLGELNDAHRSLLDPIRRAEQLLVRRGRALTPDGDPELLARVFEQREAIEDATHRRDANSLSTYAAAARARQSALIEELAAFFETEQGCVSVPQKTPIARVLDELRYLKKLIERAELTLDELL